MKHATFVGVVALMFGVVLSSARAGEVAIYTGNVNWITPEDATAQAQVCYDRLTAAGVTTNWYTDPGDAEMADLATWVSGATADGEVDVLILFGWLPPTLYPEGNTSPDGSIIENFIETTDGNAVINHADWMFYVSSAENGAAGLQNIMDIPGIVMGPDDTQMLVTDEGQEIAPHLTGFLSDRALRIDQLAGDWVVEASLAQSADGVRADPVIVRDGDRGRLIPLYMTNNQGDPKGAVASEVVAWLLGVDILPARVGLAGGSTTTTGTPTRVTVSLQDVSGLAVPAPEDITVDLESDKGTGAFDTAWAGAYDGTVTSVTIPEGALTASFWYRDSADGVATISVTPPAGLGLEGGDLMVDVLAPLDGIEQGEVVIYTGNTGWITKTLADVQAQVCKNVLDSIGVTSTWYANAADVVALSEWVDTVTGDGRQDVLVLYGFFPGTIYPEGNAMLDGSIAELFIESTDGDTIINHADYMFYVCSTDTAITPNNEAGGLQNMMDIPAITMWDDNTPMSVTEAGRAIAPSVADFLSDRPFHTNELAGQWFVEAALAENASGTRADPVIVRDGIRGRLAPVFQAADQNDPKGAAAAEIIAWLYDLELGGPAQVALQGRTATWVEEPLELTIQIQNDSGGPAPVAAETTVALGTTSGSGAFDTAADGSFDGSLTTVTLAAGESTVAVYYRDTASGSPELTATVTGLAAGAATVNVLGRTFAPPGEVAIYTGTVNWMTKAAADEQAAICYGRLDAAGFTPFLYENDTDADELAAWVESATGNGKLDVLILYGRFPDAIYGAGNTEPDGSVAEEFIESTDGDLIINHADWMFYVTDIGDPLNEAGGLQNMMDLPFITMGPDDTQMVVTDEGRAISPLLGDFLSDRPFHVDELGDDWLVEVALAQNADGTRADPIIVRDGDRGRLAPVFQAADQNDPKGAVAADIVAWLYGLEIGASRIGIAGSSTAVTGTPIRLTLSLEDGGGVSTPATEDVTIELTSDSTGGAFDTAWEGAYDGTVTSVMIPAGESSVMVWYRDTDVGTANLSVAAAEPADLEGQTLSVNVVAESEDVVPGEVLIYTGNVGWIAKDLADLQAQECVTALTDAGIPVTWISNELDVDQVAEWVDTATGDDRFDVLVLYGYLPGNLYPEGNAQPDESIAEFFIESTDGDLIMNHADWMFYVSSPDGTNNNGAGGLQNMMDLLAITMGPDDIPVEVTPEGAAIAPTLTGFLSDRSFHVDELGGEWFVEAALAENADGTRADPIVVRDGNRGRLAPVYMTNNQPDPKGVVAAEIIDWLTSKIGGDEGPVFHRGDADSSGATNITDGIYVLNFLFLGGPDPTCADAADADDSGAINITDGIYILNFLFLGGPDPLPPGPPPQPCGPDPSDDSLDCAAYDAC